VNLARYFTDEKPRLRAALEEILGSHDRNLNKLEAASGKAKEKFWWPFTQHGIVSEVSAIDSAYGDNFSVFNGAASGTTPALQFDSCGSWWTQGVGHGNSKLAKVVLFLCFLCVLFFELAYFVNSGSGLRSGTIWPCDLP